MSHKIDIVHGNGTHTYWCTEAMQWLDRLDNFRKGKT